MSDYYGSSIGTDAADGSGGNPAGDGRDPEPGRTIAEDQATAQSESAAARAGSHWRRTARRFFSQKVAVASLVFIVLLGLAAIFASVIAPYEPTEQDLLNRLQGPSADHWFGTDNLGRDTFSRLLYGGQQSLFITTAVVFIGTAIAIPIGLLSGYFSGKTDVIVMRITDAMLSIPPLVLALAVAGILGPGSVNLIIALVLVLVPGFVRLVRGTTLAVREEGFVDASRAVGTKSPSILARRILPHAMSPLLVQISIALGTILVVEASLAFLGLGEPPPTATWGGMIDEGFELIFTDARLVLVPGITVALATLAFNSIGDGLRDALAGSGDLKRQRHDMLGITSVAPELGMTESESATADDPSAPLLEIRELSLGFDTPSGEVTQVLDRVSLEVGRGEILGIVGESGCGKTVTAQSILRLLPSPPARLLGGEIRFEGRNLLDLSLKEMRNVRGNDISMIFQDPMASLNPAFTIGDQLVEAMRLHQDISKSAAETRAADLLDRVGIPAAKTRLDDFPHTFSGGMRQRALIAMALANEPKLLIADEPTTALDVTVQAQIIELIRDLRDEFGMSVIFVTHDLGVVQDLCDRVTVMYAGQVVENAEASRLFADAKHPYSAALLRSRPVLGASHAELVAIPGVVPTPADMPHGCRFAARCDLVTPECESAPIELAEVAADQVVRCIHHDQVEVGGGAPSSPVRSANGTDPADSRADAGTVTS